MLSKEPLNGKYVNLRSVNIKDSKFIIDLRNDAHNAKYIHKTDTSIAKQEEWIKKQIDRVGDYYFIMESTVSQKPIGTVALYNIEEDEAEFGRWVSFGNAFENLESAVLLHKYGYKTLKLNKILTCTVAENTPVINFWKRFGAEFVEYIEDNDYRMQKNIVRKSNFYSEIMPILEKLLKL